jgi:hypothetical protein
LLAMYGLSGGCCILAVLVVQPCRADSCRARGCACLPSVAAPERQQRLCRFPRRRFGSASTKEWGPFQVVTTANGGGRGLYFQDPNGHLLEIITRAYGKRMLRNRILIANLARVPNRCCQVGTSQTTCICGRAVRHHERIVAWLDEIGEERREPSLRQALWCPSHSRS